MERAAVFVVGLVGTLTIVIEFFTVKKQAQYISELKLIPLWLLVGLTLFFLARNLLFRKYKKKYDYLVVFIGLVSIACVCIHQYRFENISNSKTLFKARTYQIGSDGGLHFDFKKNGYVIVEKQDHWSVSEYLGTYIKNDSSLTMAVTLDFDLSRKAIIQQDSLIFEDAIRCEMIKEIE